MDKKLKSKWVKALRSGRYKQTTSFFEHDGAHCCLGVLCRVARKPPLVLGIAGNWEFVNKVLGDPSMADRLASMNDIGIQFPKIADYIEVNL